VLAEFAIPFPSVDLHLGLHTVIDVLLTCGGLINFVVLKAAGMRS
jgi:hypothetical protein